MAKSEQSEPDASVAESTGQFRVIDIHNLRTEIVANVSSHSGVTSGDTYIPVIKDAAPAGLVSVVVGLKSQEERFMEWANNWLQDEPTPEVHSD